MASYPSGHLIVTTAMAAAGGFWVPALRRPMVAYVAAVAVTRVLFGAHFPLDVVAGIGLGIVVGALAAQLVAALVPASRPDVSGAGATPASSRQGRRG